MTTKDLIETKDQIETIVKKSIAEINEMRSDKLPLDRFESIVLYGEGGVLDSLQLVNFLMSIEEKIADKLDLSLSLTSDRAVSRRVSPFRSTAHLIDFILEEMTQSATE